MKPYTLALYEKALPAQLSWREKLQQAGKLGFDALEISIDETDARLARLDWPASKRSELVSLMAGAGVPIRTMCLSGHRKYPLGASDPAVRRRGMEIMEKAIGLADDLGIRIIQLAGYDVYYEESTSDTRAWFEQNLALSVRMAASAGVMLAFETMENEFMNTVSKAMRYVNLIRSPYLAVFPDSGNLTNAALTYGDDVCDDLRTGAGHLAALHLKETVPGKFREIPFGQGHVDFQAVIPAAWELGVRKYTAECWYTGNPAWEEELAFARRLLGGILDAQV